MLNIVRRPSVLALAVFVAALTACAPDKLIEKFADDAKEQLALDYYRRFVDRDFVTLAAELEPQLQGPDVLKTFTEIRALIPDEKPATRNLAGYWISTVSGQGTTSRLAYQFGYPGEKWFLVHIGWTEKDGKRLLSTFHVQALTEDLRKTHAFTFARAGAAHFIFTALGLLIPLFVLVSFVACLRARWPKRKWLWALFVLVSMGKLTLNWTTGEIDFGIFHFLLGGAAAMTASAYSPWIISIGFPLGAVLFWVRNIETKRELRSRQASPAPVPPPPVQN